MFNYITKSSKAAIIAYVILAVAVCIGFIQINELQKDSDKRELIQQSTRYDNCLASNERILASKNINSSLIIAVDGLSRNPQHTDKTNQALKDVVGFLEASEKSSVPVKCYKPKGYISVD